jgi:glycosyltransferase involved in cell wall biosynthesis
VVKVLHVVNWFPNRQDPNQAIWIKRLIDSLKLHCQNKIYHLEFLEGSTIRIERTKTASLTQTRYHSPFFMWSLVELFHFFWLWKMFILKKEHKKYDIINFHTAYPMLTYWHRIKYFVDIPFVISEHWSAYHFNFGVKKELPRIKKIFQQNIPVIAVSNALIADIKRFSKSNFPSFVVPNVVDDQIFFIGKENKEDFLFMVSQWKSPKTPLIAMEAFVKSSCSENCKLIIAGYGPLWSDMLALSAKMKVHDKIIFLGKLESVVIADYMRRCKAFLHPTDYETFSVVCAEAVASGAYVIAPRTGGIPEVVKDRGFLLENNNINTWKRALEQIPENFLPHSESRFSKKSVGKIYFETLMAIRNETKR